MVSKAAQASDGNHDLPYEDIYATGATESHPYRRLIEDIRTLYRRNNLAGALPLGQVESLAISYESYKLAFTPGLLAQVFQCNGQALLPNPADVLGGQSADRGGYVDLDGNGCWWIPSGRVFLSPNSNDAPVQELAYARQHFFLAHRYRDPFHTNVTGTESFLTYDTHDLLLLETRDALVNNVRAVSDYRVLQPKQMTDPNGNRSEAAFDVFGLVVATAVKGKAAQILGDLLEDFDPNPPLAKLQAFGVDPRGQAASLLGKATTRIVYDLDRYQRTGQPPFAATLAREAHVSDLQPGQQTKIQIGL